MPALTVSAVLSDAWDVYRLLFRRSIVVAAMVYALINAVDLVTENVSGSIRTGLTLIGFVLSFAGPVIVQGALVRIVRSVHEGTRPDSAATLFRAAGDRIGSLIGASLLYSLGIVIGLILVVVPGLLVAARWSLMAPAIMLEGRYAMDAQRRSIRVVRGEDDTGLGDRTWFAFGVVFVSWLLAGAVPALIAYSTYAGVWDWGAWALSIVATTLAAPYQAHVLSVLYYRLVDPRRPAVDPQVWRWPSVWQGAVPESA